MVLVPPPGGTFFFTIIPAKTKTIKIPETIHAQRLDVFDSAHIS